MVITFDDGNADVLTNALPVMRRYGLNGVMYVVSGAVDAEGYLTVEQLKQLLEAGWEIGTHTATHPDLAMTDNLSAEIYGSKRVLDSLLGIDVQTLAYPFGRVDRRVFQKVSNYGFLAAVCLNPTNHQASHKLFCLSRREVKFGCSLEEFRALLQPDP